MNNLFKKIDTSYKVICLVVLMASIALAGYLPSASITIYGASIVFSWLGLVLAVMILVPMLAIKGLGQLQMLFDPNCYVDCEILNAVAFLSTLILSFLIIVICK